MGVHCKKVEINWFVENVKLMDVFCKFIDMMYVLYNKFDGLV